MDATAILEKLSNLRIRVTVVGNGERLRMEPGSAVPADLVEDIKAHKAELLAFLQKPQVKPGPPEWHAKEVARAVEREGYCLFWSELFHEVVAFIRDDTFRGAVPASIVTYTSAELLQLFGDSKTSPSAKKLRLIHEAKKLGGHILYG